MENGLIIHAQAMNLHENLEGVDLENFQVGEHIHMQRAEYPYIMGPGACFGTLPDFTLCTSSSVSFLRIAPDFLS